MKNFKLPTNQQILNQNNFYMVHIESYTSVHASHYFNFYFFLQKNQEKLDSLKKRISTNALCNLKFSGAHFQYDLASVFSTLKRKTCIFIEAKNNTVLNNFCKMFSDSKNNFNCFQLTFTHSCFSKFCAKKRNRIICVFERVRH